MADNTHTDAALRFHDATKYRVVTLPSRDPDYLCNRHRTAVEPPIWEEDWSLEPHPYKVYSTLAPLALPADLIRTHVQALEALADRGQCAGSSAPVPARAALAQVARLSNGLLNRRHITPIRKRIVDFRTAGAAGARYHLELYFVCGELPDLPAGVYQYNTLDHSLRLLGAGDLRASWSRPAEVSRAWLRHRSRSS
jgi:hypothetical protein